MTTKIDCEGGCLCGSVRYVVSGEVMGAGACHCRDCQYVCGGAASNVLVVSGSALQITKGEPKTFRSTADSGAIRIRHFCPTCGTPLFAEDAAYPNIVTIKAGSLDDPSLFKPTAHFWMQSAPSWHDVPEDAICFDKGAAGPKRD